MKPEQFIREFGVEKARSLLEQRNRCINVEKPTHFDTDLDTFYHIDDITELDESDIDLSELNRAVKALEVKNKVEAYEKRVVHSSIYGGGDE
ncbi:hypothetical protein AB0T07_02535 [Acinetobacter baumannii]|uniref:hypothetical protein n=1 Tax=Acinetobacter baumannii TaxID=470 RepID=UPI00344E82A3